MAQEAEKGALQVLVIPEDGRDSRSFRISRHGLRLLAGGAAVVAILLGAVLGSWWYLAARAALAGELEERVVDLEERQRGIDALVVRLEEAERRYARIRGMFGSDTTRASPNVWLPPVGGGAASPDRPGGNRGLPTSWPLTQRGFITQPLVAGDEGEHQGLDIAIPGDSYIRAAGAGTVAEVGEDPIYGRFVILEHQDGYRTLYGHASETLVEAGQQVRQNEVIALSGSTGRSTAPHLHFEILHEGEPVDPLTLVHQP